MGVSSHETQTSRWIDKQTGNIEVFGHQKVSQCDVVKIA